MTTHAASGTEHRYRLGLRVHAARMTRPHVRRPSDPVSRALRVFAIDPLQPRAEGAWATLRIPWEPLRPGPLGALFDVDAHDAVAQVDYLAVDLDAPRALIEHGHAPAVDNPQFHQQMVYAVAASVHAAFTRALGRTPAFAIQPRGDGIARLRLRPHGVAGIAAWYDRARGEVVFGYSRGRDGFVFTCLAHDVIAHEVCHALVDGLRGRFDVPTNPDVLALHEAIADLVGLFLRLECTELVAACLARSGVDLRHAEALAGIARQAGQERRQSALRSALDRCDGQLRRYDGSLGPHALGGVLVAAVFDAFTMVFDRKAAPYLRLAGSRPPGSASAELPRLLARECAALARQFLTMCVRALDYCPPADVEFGEFLRAVVTADRDLVPEDPWQYRQAWIDAFVRRGIYPADIPVSGGDRTLAWSRPDTPLPALEALRFSARQLEDDPAQAPSEQEIERQARGIGALIGGDGGPWRFGLAAPGEIGGGAVADLPVIESVRPLRRQGPDGLTRFDTVAEVTQQVVVATEAGSVPLIGGCTIIVGPSGDIRYVIRKGLRNAVRIADRVRFVQRAGPALWRRTAGRWHANPAALRALDAEA